VQPAVNSHNKIEKVLAALVPTDVYLDELLHSIATCPFFRGFYRRCKSVQLCSLIFLSVIAKLTFRIPLKCTNLKTTLIYKRQLLCKIKNRKAVFKFLFLTTFKALSKYSTRNSHSG